MKVLLVTISSEYRSAQRLGFKTVTEAPCSSDFKDDTVLIRWGNSGACCKDAKNVVNPSNAIHLNCCKDEALAELAKVVHTPRIFRGDVPEGVEAVYRRNEHAGGSDFSVKKGPFKVERGHYASEFIRARRELRVWFSPNNAFAGVRVPLKRLGQVETEFTCRSEWGYRYVAMPKGLKADTLNAAKQIGLHFGAADILQAPNGRYLFLELNSAPTVDTNIIEKFFRAELKAHIATIEKGLTPA